jgi:hypothetical protein
MVGGMLALTGAIAVGPRIGRFEEKDKTLRGHTVPVRIFLPTFNAFFTIILFFLLDTQALCFLVGTLTHSMS